MAGATVQVRSGQSSSASVSVAITTSAGNLLAICTGGFNGAGSGVGAPTRTGETNNNAIAEFNDGLGDRQRGDYMMSIGGNSNAVTGNGSSGGGTACDVYELSGCKTSAALGAVNHAIGTSTTIQPGSITPTAGSVVITSTNDDGSGTSASTISDAAFTYTVDEAGGAGTVWDEASAVCGSAHVDNVTASATNPTWTTHHAGVAHMTAMIMEFLASAGGGATPVAPTMRTMRGAGI